MKNLVLAGVLSTLSVVGTVGIMAPTRATDDSLPVGTIIAWGGVSSSVPANWMLCNGEALSKAVYKELFTAIGTSWGSAGDKFNLPDLRGRFLRGDDAGTGRDPDVKKRKPSNPGGSATGVGSVQEDALQNHTHDQNPHSHSIHLHSSTIRPAISVEDPYWASSSPVANADNTGLGKANILGVIKFNTKSRVNAGEESRPKNVAVNFIIKVK
jgi:microcystin-dependent protein